MVAQLMVMYFRPKLDDKGFSDVESRVKMYCGKSRRSCDTGLIGDLQIVNFILFKRQIEVSKMEQSAGLIVQRWGRFDPFHIPETLSYESQ